MKRLTYKIWNLKIWADNRGQDLVEYALLTAFLASAFAVISPGVADIFGKVAAILVTKVGGDLVRAGG
jgi:Flp pilus assembly pilin Flp